MIRLAKKKHNALPDKNTQDKPATLKDLLNPRTLEKLKLQAHELKTAEEKRKADARRQEEEARKAEQKRLENDFEHLLKNSSMDWRSYK